MSVDFLTDLSEDTDLNKIGFIGSGFSVSAGNGRFGSASLRSTQNGFRKIALSGQLATIVANMSVNLETSFTSGGDRMGFAFMDDVSQQVGWTINNLNQIVVGRGANQNNAGTVLATVASPLVVGVHNHIEFKATIHNTAGIVQLWLNGVLVVNLSSQNTRFTSNNYADSIGFFHGNFGTGAGRLDFSQILLINTSGDDPVDVIGDIRMISDAPTGDSATEQMSRSTGSDSFALIDETPANDDTDYIFDNVSGNKTRLTFPNLSVSPITIHCVALKVRAKKTDAGAITFNHNILSDASENNGPNQAPATEYSMFTHVWPLDPDGNVAWTESQINAASIGVKIT